MAEHGKPESTCERREQEIPQLMSAYMYTHVEVLHGMHSSSSSFSPTGFEAAQYCTYYRTP